MPQPAAGEDESISSSINNGGKWFPKCPAVFEDGITGTNALGDA